MRVDPQTIDQWRRALMEAADGAAPDKSCPTPERLWAASRGELPATELNGLLDHATECALCTRALALARQLGAQVENEVPSESGAAPVAGLRRWYLPTAATLAATLLVVAGVRWYQPETSPGAEFRELAGYRPASLIDDQDLLLREECLLRWSPGPQGTRYAVQVATQDLQIVAQAHALEEAEFRVAATALKGLPAETKLLWRVEARLPDGTRASSQTFVHELR